MIKFFPNLSLEFNSIIQNMDFLAPKFFPVFSCRKFPIEVAAIDMSIQEQKSWEKYLFNNIENITLRECEGYHRFIKSNLSIKVPISLKGECLKGEGYPCKASKDKFSCSTCGKIFLPGSYSSKTCKDWEYPWWFPYLKEEIDLEIEARGGVSDIGPLIWTHSKCYRPMEEALNNKDGKIEFVA